MYTADMIFWRNLYPLYHLQCKPALPVPMKVLLSQIMIGSTASARPFSQQTFHRECIDPCIKPAFLRPLDLHVSPSPTRSSESNVQEAHECTTGMASVESVCVFVNKTEY